MALVLVVRRHGLVVHRVPLAGAVYRIGSAEDCEVRLNDEFLSPYIAEVRRAGEGYTLADTGLSLQGVLKNGARLEEERLAPGAAYSIGSFEIGVEGEGAVARPPTMAEEQPAGTVRIGQDVLAQFRSPPREGKEAGRPSPPRDRKQQRPEIPPTIVEDLEKLKGLSAGIPARPAAIPRETAVPPRQPGTLLMGEDLARQMGVGEAAAPKKKPKPATGSGSRASGGLNLRKKIIIALAAFIVLTLMLAVVFKSGPGKKVDEQHAPIVATATPASAASVSPAPSPVLAVPVEASPVAGTAVAPSSLAEGEAAFAAARFDEALSAWERGAQSGDEGSATRLAEIAYKLGLVFAGDGQRQRARTYWQRAVAHGAPDSPYTAKAKAALERP